MHQQHPQSHHRPVKIVDVRERKGECVGGMEGGRGEQMSDGGTRSRQIECHKSGRKDCTVLYCTTLHYTTLHYTTTLHLP